MKITIPSRISAPTAPPDGSSTASASLAGEAASNTAAGPSSSTTNTATYAKPIIKIKSSSTPGFGNVTSIRIPPQKSPNVQQAALQQPVKVEPQDAQSEDTTNKRKRINITSNYTQSAQSTPSTSSAQPATLARSANDATHQDGLKLYNKLRDYKKEGHVLSTEFLHLPSPMLFPDYYQIIKKPISFADVRAKLDRGEYTSVKAVHDDFHQMFINAKRYNQSGSDIFNAAKRLDRLAKTTLAKMGAGPVGDDKSDDDDDAGMADDRLPTTAANTSSKPSSFSAPSGATRPPKKKQKSSAGGGGGGASNVSRPPMPPNGMSHTEAAMQAAKEEGKAITMTRWLIAKLDDLRSKTDGNGRYLSDMFMTLPRQDLYPDYYQLIQRPIAFTMIKSRLKNRNYQSMQAFIQDVNAVFNNAQYYNEEGSQVWQDARNLQETFADLMKEADNPPEFFMRPRKINGPAGDGTDGAPQRSVSPDKENQPSSRLRAKAENHQGNRTTDLGGGITLSMGPDGIKNIAFSDAFDDPGAVSSGRLGSGPSSDPADTTFLRHSRSDDMAIDSKPSRFLPPPGVGDTRVPSPIPPHLQPHPSGKLSPAAQIGATSGTPVPLAAPVRTGPKAKILSRLVKQGQTSLVARFEVTLARPSSSLQPSIEHILPNTIICQHTVSCPRDIERIDVVPFLTDSQKDIKLNVTVRPHQIMTLADAPTSDDQRALGASKTKWHLRPAAGLQVLEISTPGNEEVYRLFVQKEAVAMRFVR